jgi:hypothetical protein
VKNGKSATKGVVLHRRVAMEIGKVHARGVPPWGLAKVISAAHLQDHPTVLLPVFPPARHPMADQAKVLVALTMVPLRVRRMVLHRMAGRVKGRIMVRTTAHLRVHPVIMASTCRQDTILNM